MNVKKQLAAPVAVCIGLAVAAFFAVSSCRTFGPGGTSGTGTSNAKDVAVGGGDSKQLLYVLKGETKDASIICVTTCDGTPGATPAEARLACKNDPKGMTVADFYSKFAYRARDLRKVIDVEIHDGSIAVRQLGPVVKARVNQQIKTFIVAAEPRCVAAH